MKDYSFAAIVFSLVSVSSFAAPCFHQGEYEGMGVSTDTHGNTSTYSVKTSVLSKNQAYSFYSWSPNGRATLDIVVEGNALFVNGSSTSVGMATCGMATSRLSMKTSIGNQNTQVDEEWAVLGNYLLRNGTKVINDQTIHYQELLIRKD